MKRTLPFICVLLPAALTAQTLIFEEDFDDHSAGSWVAADVGLPWSTWDNSQGGSYDTQLSDEQASSGEVSMLLSSTLPGGGPSDIVLRLGDQTTGIYSVSWNMYIPSGFGGYFNIQHYEVIANGSWAAEFTFRASGMMEFSSNIGVITASYPHDQWFPVEVVVDLDEATGALHVDGGQVTTWNMLINAQGQAGMSQLGGINFYASAGGDQTRYYVDDVLFQEIFSVGTRELPSDRVRISPNPVSDVVTVELPGAQGAQVRLLDMSGRQLIMPSPVINGSAIRLDLSSLPAGIYHLEIVQAERRTLERVVKH